LKLDVIGAVESCYRRACDDGAWLKGLLDGCRLPLISRVADAEEQHAMTMAFAHRARQIGLALISARS
jgi:hypothetical protein